MPMDTQEDRNQIVKSALLAKQEEEIFLRLAKDCEKLPAEQEEVIRERLLARFWEIRNEIQATGDDLRDQEIRFMRAFSTLLGEFKQHLVLIEDEMQTMGGNEND